MKIAEAVARQYVIFDCPDDYPDQFVVRGFTIDARGRATADQTPTAVYPTYHQARKAIPKSFNVRIIPDETDPPSIVETWT